MELLTYIFLSPIFVALLLFYVFACGAFGLLIFGVFGLEKIFMFVDKEKLRSDGFQSLVAEGVWSKWQFWICFLVGILATYVGFIINDKFGGLYVIGFALSPVLFIYLRLKLFDIFKKESDEPPTY